MTPKQFVEETDRMITDLTTHFALANLIECAENLDRAIGGEIIYPECQSMRETITKARYDAQATINKARQLLTPTCLSIG